MKSPLFVFRLTVFNISSMGADSIIVGVVIEQGHNKSSTEQQRKGSA
jgi:hypothetical protein